MPKWAHSIVDNAIPRSRLPFRARLQQGLHSAPMASSPTGRPLPREPPDQHMAALLTSTSTTDRRALYLAEFSHITVLPRT